MEEYLVCEICDKQSEDVRFREDGYRQDVNHEPDAMYTVCDYCDQECLNDI